MSSKQLGAVDPDFGVLNVTDRSAVACNIPLQTIPLAGAPRGIAD